MEFIVPLRSVFSCWRRHAWGLALAIGFAASLLSAPAAFADVENQEEIDALVQEYEASVAEARANIPDSKAMKDAEDALDAAARAETNAEAAAKVAKEKDRGASKARKEADAAKNAHAAAEQAADAARAKETSEADKERAQKYREALARRRAASIEMAALADKMQGKLSKRRQTSGDKELDIQIVRLRSRVTQAQRTITPVTTTSQKSYPSVKANVSTDSQKNCTFGKAGPSALAFEPADGDGNPLNASLPAGVIGLAPGPININNPDPDAPKPKKKEGGAANTAADGPQNASPSVKQVPDKTAANSTPAAGKPSAPSSLDMLGGSILDQIEPTPQRPADGGIFPNLPNGKPPEVELDRLTKLAEEALVRGDRATFESYREEARAIAFEIAARIYQRSDLFSKFGIVGLARPRFDDTLEGDIRRARYEAEVALYDRWSAYFKEVALWGGNPSSSPGSEPQAGTNAGTGNKTPTKTATPEPVSPGTASPAGASPTSPPAATPAAESKPGQAETGKTTETGKTAAPADPPSRPAAPGDKSASPVEKSSQKAEPADKTLSSSTPASNTPVSSTPAGSEAAARTITVYFKVEEAVLKGGAQGDEIKEGQLAKLTAEEPELPKTGRTKTAKTQVDKGYDKSPVMCATDGGRCKAQVPADERDSYGLSVLPPAAAPRDKPGSNADLMREFIRRHGGLDSDNYSVQLMPAHTTGVVLNKTSAALVPKQLAALADAPSGVMVSKADFKVGGKSYTRIGITGPPAVVAQLAKALTDAFGKDAQIDQCDEKAPGPPLGMTPVSFSALNRELPYATLDLHGSAQFGADQ